MLCILYILLTSALLGVVGLVAESALPARFPRRWMWCGLMMTSVVLPGYNRFHNTFSVTGVLEDHSMRTMSLGVTDPAWWIRAESYDTQINPVWMTASAIVVLWVLVSVLRVAWLVFRARQSRAASTVIDGVPVVVTDSLGPATVGILRSKVLVPRWVLALPRAQRQYVLCHEEQHRKAHDSLVLFASSLVLIVMPWNIALWWQVRRLSLAVELDCDNRVVSKLGNPRAYGELLLRVAEAASRGPRLQPALLGVGMLEKRLTVLLAPTRLRKVQQFVLPLLAVGLLIAILSMPHPVLGHGSHAHAAMTLKR